jgi:peptidoglycan/LPS O-acetylase OafA/YrhL
MYETKLRYDFLDWLRVLAIALLLFYHTGMLFVGWGWHIENADILTELRWPMSIAHRLRMPLLFIISGAGLWFALRRRSGAEVVRERSLRLLLPALAGMLLIVPPQIYYERLFRGQWQGSYLSFFWERVLQFQPYPHGDFSWHHLWFIVYLYVYVLLMLPAMLWWRRSQRRLRPGVWLYALAVPLAINEMVLRPLYPETHNLVADWYLFIHYLLFTVYGFVLASTPQVWEWLEAQRRHAAFATMGLLAAIIPLMIYGIIRSGSALDACVANVFTWLGLMALLGYGRRYLSRSNAWLQWARDACYPIYILHQTLIVAVGYFVIQLDWHPWLKFAVVVTVTLVGCVVLYELAVRRWSVTRILFGMKAQTPRSTPALHAEWRGAN